MRNTVTVMQRFPSWGAAYDARARLAEDDGFDRYSIDEVEIGRFGNEFALLVQTDEFHRDQIEHLLRSAGTRFNPPLRPAQGRSNSASPLVLLGAAAVAGVLTFVLLNRRKRVFVRSPHGMRDRSRNGPEYHARKTRAARPIGALRPISGRDCAPTLKDTPFSPIR